MIESNMMKKQPPLKQSTQTATTVDPKHVQSMLKQLDIQSNKELTDLIEQLKESTIEKKLPAQTTEIETPSKIQEQLLSQLSPLSQTMGITIGISDLENSKNQLVLRFPELTPEKCQDFLDALGIDTLLQRKVTKSPNEPFALHCFETFFRSQRARLLVDAYYEETASVLQLTIDPQQTERGWSPEKGQQLTQIINDYYEEEQINTLMIEELDESNATEEPPQQPTARKGSESSDTSTYSKESEHSSGSSGSAGLSTDSSDAMAAA